MWKTNKTYRYVPSGEASELHIKILGSRPLKEGIDWYEQTYNRPFYEDDATRAYKAIIVRGGYDADIYHRKGSEYYVFDSDFKPSHSQPKGIIEVK